MPSAAPRLRVILHADDLGISHPVNDAIFYLMDQGLLTSASILANGPAFEDAARRSHHFPHCSFGVHLNITQFRPLHPSPGLAGFLRPDGAFHTSHSVVPGFASQRALLDEWTAQVQKVRDAGVPVTHIDSHHHVHTRLSLLRSTRRLCREQSIARARIRHTFAGQRVLARWRIDSRLCNCFLRRNLICADEFGPFSAFASAAPRLRDGSTVELMVHPGHPAYIAEIEDLQRGVNREFLRKHQCITYRDLS
jgi:predicted glycoside hydrolase/deacetylase ChbG (UPF0249 family)